MVVIFPPYSTIFHHIPPYFPWAKMRCTSSAWSGGSQDEPRSLGTVIRLLGQEARVPISRVILMTARIGARIKISQKEEQSVMNCDEFLWISMKIRQSFLQLISFSSVSPNCPMSIFSLEKSRDTTASPRSGRQELYFKIRELCVQDPGETHRGIDFPCFLQLMWGLHRWTNFMGTKRAALWKTFLKTQNLDSLDHNSYNMM